MGIVYGPRPSAPGEGLMPPKPTWRVPGYFVNELRDFLMDYDRFNEVIEGEEHSDEKLAKMIIQAILTYNATPPFDSALNINSFEVMAQEQWILILDVAAARALMSVTNKLQRNHMSYRDKDIEKQINERWQYYERQISRLLGGNTGSDGAYTRLKEFKVHLNSNMCMGSAHSELMRWMHPFTGNYIDVVV